MMRQYGERRGRHPFVTVEGHLQPVPPGHTKPMGCRETCNPRRRFAAVHQLPCMFPLDHDACWSREQLSVAEIHDVLLMRSSRAEHIEASELRPRADRI